MKILALALIAAFLSCTTPTAAQARTHISFGIGLGLGGCCGYSPYYSPYYYGYPTYYAPPPMIVYAAPPPPPVIYVTPPPSALPATQSSPTFVDSLGRTCRQFQTYINAAPLSGTACLQEDGTWRIVGE